MNYQGPGLYRHYKGGEYLVLGLALQEDTLIKPGQPEHANAGPERRFAVYWPLTPGSLLEQRDEDYWAREFSDFNAKVVDDHFRSVPRFELIRLIPISEYLRQAIYWSDA